MFNYQIPANILSFSQLYNDRTGYNTPEYGHPAEYTMIEVIFPQNQFKRIHIDDLKTLDHIPLTQIYWRPDSKRKYG